MFKTIARTFFMTFSILAAVSFSGQAFASQCKGMTDSACSASDACSWVAGYQRKDGRKVKSFCRAKPNFKNSTQAKSKLSNDIKASSLISKN